MRLGGFVIHGNARETLGPCLEGPLEVCDEVVAVDSGATDGSSSLARAAGARQVLVRWEGYGAARAAAAAALSGCDYLFFLDADERLAEGAAEQIRAWRASCPRLPHYRLPRRDWADLATGRFLFRVERHVRLVRGDAATWQAKMIVHEALPRRPSLDLAAAIDHRFATSLEELEAKQERYALLWALRARGEGWAAKSTFGRRAAHLLRDAVLKGALFRGGVPALRLAWAVSRYHVRKYQLLREVRMGKHEDLVRAFDAGRFAELFEPPAPPASTEGQKP
ncbi:MAG: glycosyltransferase [Deltaproteobacteria bacterium]|nr:glycosyltransferase [Deltaproteobacteria bacterium]